LRDLFFEFLAQKSQAFLFEKNLQYTICNNGLDQFFQPFLLFSEQMLVK
jgi:hypothetical protein